MERIKLKTKSNCKYCLGSGKATAIILTSGTTICACILEQLEILYDPKDEGKWMIPAEDRYTPGYPMYTMKRESEIDYPPYDNK